MSENTSESGSGVGLVDSDSSSDELAIDEADVFCFSPLPDFRLPEGIDEIDHFEMLGDQRITRDDETTSYLASQLGPEDRVELARLLAEGKIDAEDFVRIAAERIQRRGGSARDSV